MQKKGDCFAFCHSGLNRIAHRIKSVQVIILIAPDRIFELGNHPGTPGPRHLHQTESLFQFPFIHLSNTHCFSVSVSKSVVQSTVNYQQLSKDAPLRGWCFPNPSTPRSRRSLSKASLPEFGSPDSSTRELLQAKSARARLICSWSSETPGLKHRRPPGQVASQT